MRVRGPRPSPSGEHPKPEEGEPEPQNGETKPDEKKEDAKPGEAPTEGNKGPIQRKDEPDQPSDPQELKVRPDERGMVRFNFRGQAWPDVLDWLADISNTSLDWQELPGDYLNLTTQRAYSVDEVRDLLNERLMTRGYTILQQREGFVVAKLEGLNPARVPRVYSEDLRYRDDHEFVKVSFPLSWLIAEDAVEELKPMLSKHGSMSALATSNRLEVLDVVSNLREIQHVLQEEQSSEVRSSKVHEFFLRYTRAEDVVAQLQSLLGISKPSGGGMAMNPQMMQQMQQMQQQMMQQMQQQQPGGNSGGRRRSNSTDNIHLVINSRQNSIIANAPPDKIVVIAEAVKMFDVPPQPGATIGANFQRVKVFRLAQLDPKALQSMLLQAGNLDPTTQLVADDKNKALIAYATPADQITIETLISKLDGTGRQFKVIRLRRLQADYVAGSIQFMMGSEEEEDDSNSRRGYYSFYSYGRQQEDTKSKDKFRVDADVVNNRLLLWANEVELEAVENLLVQLGEIPAGGDSQRGRLRTLDLGSSQSAQELVKKLKEVWPQVSPAPLKIEVAEPKKKPEPEPTKTEETQEKKPDADSSVMHQHGITVPVHLAVASQKEDAASDEPVLEEVAADDNQLDGLSQEELMRKYFPQAAGAGEQKKPAADQPVVIQVDENGRITLASENPAVLDLLEDVLLEMTPPPKDYEVFELKHAPALFVSWNLEDFFEEEEEKESNSRSPWFWDFNQQDKKDDSRRLSQRAPIKFLADIDTNTILVQNATAEQLETVRELIQLYDKPEPVVEESKRLNATYAVRYSRASAIAESVKEVFRDLLSSNDKSLQAPPQQSGERGRNEERSASDYISRSGSAFRGKLSIGVDDISNTLLISAEGESLMTLVMDMVKRIDESAKQVSTVRVVNLKTGVGGDKFRELLNRLLEKVDPQQLQQQQQMQDQNGQPGGPQPNPNGQRGPRNWQQNRGQSQVLEVEN
ncbi:secretin N-terminal domain-containing protein [Bremerella sp. P1]|uniref:secretin N-terminal domain-containing protein n=1 Tax=Bremerella sp. P1 TaxID=3026424 RepID=UPI002368E9A6|nr:secretin N-terminal domain-containing protein [Bremerella sp. P1]WDI39784.1 secretin N-terminal domain-containing protein [Bremerella sp. P1]